MQTKGKYLIVIGLVAAAAGWILLSSSGSRKTKAQPEDTVMTFCAAVTTGDMNQIRELCDTLQMREYLNRLENIWSDIADEGEKVVEIAASLLKCMETSITHVEKLEDRRAVSFRLESEGMVKEKTAILRNEEGAWKIESLQDRY